MPHQCIECGRTFPDGSKEMLSGCPDCGGNKFQFKPGGVTESPDPEATPASETATGSEPAPDFDSSSDVDSERSSPDPASPVDTSDSLDSPDGTDAPGPVDRRPERAVSSGTADPDTTDPVEGDAERIDDEEAEDTAQASARSDVVTPDELDRATREAGDPAIEAPANGSESAEPPGSQPGVDELRDELNEQFESIKIVSPGQYELNLMELYDRQEYIISLQEDGRYVIEMPDAWGVTDE